MTGPTVAASAVVVVDEPCPTNGRDSLIEAYERAQDLVVHLRAAVARYDAQAGYVQDSTTGPVSGHFGLTYANYHVLHRTLMQSMPIEWQHRMVDCLQELHEAYRHVQHAECYIVTPATEVTYGDLTETQAKDAGVTLMFGFDGDRGGDSALVAAYTDAAGRIHQSWERTSIPAGEDPIPDYDRGRAYIAPLGADQTIGAEQP